MRRAGGSQEQRRRVDRSAGDDEHGRIDSTRLTIPLHLDGLDRAAGGIGDEAARARVRPEADIWLLYRMTDAAHVGVALRVDLARERVAGVTEHAAAGLTGPQQPERQRRRMQAESLQLVNDVRHAGRVGNGLVRKRPARHFRRIDAVLSAHVVQALGPPVERLERLVVDRPRRGDAVDVLDRLEVFAPEAVEHAAPELGVPADTVVRVRLKLAAALIEPALLDPVAEMFPDRFRAPVLVFLRNKISALENEDARRGAGQRLRQRPAAGAAADDDDVVAFVPHPF